MQHPPSFADLRSDRAYHLAREKELEEARAKQLALELQVKALAVSVEKCRQAYRANYVARGDFGYPKACMVQSITVPSHRADDVRTRVAPALSIVYDGWERGGKRYEVYLAPEAVFRQ